MGYLLAVTGAALALGVAAVAQRWAGLDDLSTVFIVAVLIVASRTRTGPALVTAVLCFLGYNFFFIEPRYTFAIGAWRDVVTLSLFLVAALVTGRLASALAMQVGALARAHRFAVARHRLSNRLGDATTAAEAVAATVDTLRHCLEGKAWIQLGDRPYAQPPGEEEHGWWFLPLQRQGTTLGQMALKSPPHREPLDATQRALAQAIGDELVHALSRLSLLDELHAERLAGETQRLRAALLSSVSHDLRTPLATIIGAASSLRNYGHSMNAEERGELLDTVSSEGERLDRYIQNLLDMTRLGQGTLTPQREWTDAEAVVESALVRLQTQRPGTTVNVAIPTGLPSLWVQSALLEQALLNVIDNAARYSPAGEAVQVDACVDEAGAFVIDVTDRGPGIPSHDLERVFDMFYQVEPGDRGRGGTGLGLSICRGMLVAHGGTAEARHGPDGRGTTIRLRLPLVTPWQDDA